ncbi:MAG: 50S ribosomal protein L25 [Parcubacteria group bacterium]|nr:50S ribosomal protein L25 [Parcubacteria group bacterium]
MAIALHVKQRQSEKKAHQLRHESIIPAVFYGRNIENRSLEVPSLDFDKAMRGMNGTELLDLIIENEAPIKVLVQDIAYHPVTDKAMHVDFYAVNMEQKIAVKVKLRLMGVAPAEKELGAMVMRGLDSLKIECLPSRMVSFVEVDISGLRDFSDTIRVKDIKLGDDIRILENPQAMIVTVLAPKIEAVAAVETPVAAEPVKTEAAPVEKKEEKKSKA